MVSPVHTTGHANTIRADYGLRVPVRPDEHGALDLNNVVERHDALKTARQASRALCV